MEWHGLLIVYGVTHQNDLASISLNDKPMMNHLKLHIYLSNLYEI